jgi:outer membrane protein assembly factor BamD
MRIASCVAGVVIALGLGGCASITEDPTAKWTVEQFYTEAHTALEEKNYQQAIDNFNKLEARYPYGPYAEQAQLEIAYAHYKNDEPVAAVGAADRFIKQYPTHPNVDYAYYIRGLASYDPRQNFLEVFAPQDPTARDASAAREAFGYFKDLVTRFPNSKYAEDSVLRMNYLRNGLAGYEIHVADYYMRRKAWAAAASRGKYVVENYQRTPAVADALAIMVTAYRNMQMKDLADDAEKVLKLNYPDRTPWSPGKE